MAGRDVFGELARKPLGYKLGLLAGVLAVLVFLYWQFMYSGLDEQLTRARGKNRTLQQQNEKLKKDKKEWDQLVLQEKELKEELTRNKVSLPEAAELPSFFYHLQKQAAGAGIKVNNWSRVKESPVESYIKVPVKMEIIGTFYQINNYFKLLYETDRIITVENLTLGFHASSNEEIKVKANFLASTFRLPDAPKAKADKDKGGKKAEANKGGKSAPKKSGGK